MHQQARSDERRTSAGDQSISLKSSPGGSHIVVRMWLILFGISDVRFTRQGGLVQL